MLESILTKHCPVLDTGITNQTIKMITGTAMTSIGTTLILVIFTDKETKERIWVILYTIVISNFPWVCSSGGLPGSLNLRHGSLEQSHTHLTLVGAESGRSKASQLLSEFDGDIIKWVTEINKILYCTQNIICTLPNIPCIIFSEHILLVCIQISSLPLHTSHTIVCWPGLRCILGSTHVTLGLLALNRNHHSQISKLSTTRSL